jgi:hypothetical protein
MAGYFSYFNKIAYNLEDNVTSTQLVTNLLQRSAFLKEVAENTAIAYEYQLSDGDTPETIAHKLYGDSNRHWIILLFNKLINPQYEFPLTGIALDKYIMRKHGKTLAEALSQVYVTRKIIEKVLTEYGVVKYRTTEKYELSTIQANFDTGATSELPVVDIGVPYPVVAESFSTTFTDGTTLTQTVTLEALSYYDYEVEQNEAKRTIKLLDVSYISRVEDEFMKLMSNG